MPLTGFEPTIAAGEWSQTYALDRAATGIGTQLTLFFLSVVSAISFNEESFPVQSVRNKVQTRTRKPVMIKGNTHHTYRRGILIENVV